MPPALALELEPELPTVLPEPERFEPERFEPELPTALSELEPPIDPEPVLVPVLPPDSAAVPVDPDGPGPVLPEPVLSPSRLVEAVAPARDELPFTAPVDAEAPLPAGDAHAAKVAASAERTRWDRVHMASRVPAVVLFFWPRGE